MTIDMQDNNINSVDQLQALIQVAKSLKVENIERKDEIDEVYEWMNNLLTRLKYRTLRKKDKSIVRKYFEMYSNYTKSHIDHLISKHLKKCKIIRAVRTQPTFDRIYTKADVELLAEVAEAYSHQNGRALKEVCGEMYTRYNDIRFERLQNISVSHIYNLKKTDRFKENALSYTKTRPTTVNIGERKKPYPDRRPGFLRVDSVHQGDMDKVKGVYHINLVDEVTQDEIVVCVEGISEYFLAPALEEALKSFPFKIINFHSDNGSEYINKTVAKLLKKLHIKQTKSRSRKSNDNALAEGKNAAVIRKNMGKIHIPKKHAKDINIFYKKYLNPFVRFHRFCLFPEEKIGKKGKIIKVYKECTIPVMKLLSLPDCEKYLKIGVTKELLEEEISRQTHLEVATEMQKAKYKLFKNFQISRRKC